jgi:hypothetical protein
LQASTGKKLITKIPAIIIIIKCFTTAKRPITGKHWGQINNNNSNNKIVIQLICSRASQHFNGQLRASTLDKLILLLLLIIIIILII